MYVPVYLGIHLHISSHIRGLGHFPHCCILGIRHLCLAPSLCFPDMCRNGGHVQEWGSGDGNFKCRMGMSDLGIQDNLVVVVRPARGGGWCDSPCAKLEHGYIARYTDKTTACKRDP